MHYSFTYFLRDKYAALRKHKTIFLMILFSFIIFSIYLVLAFTAITVTPTQGQNISGATYQLQCNITLTELEWENISNVNFYYGNDTTTTDGITNIDDASLIGTNSSLQGGGNATGNDVIYTLDWDTTLKGDGVYNITCLADNATLIPEPLDEDTGTNRSSNVTGVTINNLAPTYADMLPAASVNYTSDRTPIIFVNITDLGTGVNATWGNKNQDDAATNMTLWMELFYQPVGGSSPPTFWNVTETVGFINAANGSTTGSGYQVSYTWGTDVSNEPELIGGENITIRVNARDNYDGRSMATLVWNITIDLNAPTILIDTPSESMNLTGAEDNITAKVTDDYSTSVNVSDVFAALHNGSDTTAHYYALDDSDTELSGDYRTWTRLDQSGSSDFFNATLNSNIFDDGTYTLYVNATDKAGNLKQNNSRNITIDNTAPSAFTLTSPANNTNSTVLTPTLVWDATTETNFLNYTVQIADNSGFSSITYTETITSLNTVSSTTATVSSALSTDTIYYWRATAWDDAGNSYVTPKFIYITDTTNPTVTVDTPSGNVNLTGAADNVTVTVSENVSAIYAALKNSTGYYALDDSGTELTGDFTTWTALTHSSARVWYKTTINSNIFADGTYTLYVNATDMANNNGTNSDRTITIDNTDPLAFNLVLPTNATITTNSTPTLQWEATTETNLLNYTIQIDEDSAFGSITLTKSTSVDNITGIVTADSLGADTVYYWRATAWDAAGNSKVTPIFKYTTDNTKPLMNISLPANNSNLTAASDTINVTVGDTNIDTTNVYAALGNATNNYTLAGIVGWSALEQNDTGNDFGGSLKSDNFADGSYRFWANATDSAGNWNISSITMNIDNTAPDYSSLQPANSSFTNDATPTISVSLTDVTTDVDNNSIEVKYRLDGGGWTNFSSAATKNRISNGQQVSFTFGSQPDGRNITIFAQAQDSVGNRMSAVTWNFTVDITNPTLSITTPANNTNQTISGLNITVQYTDTNRNVSDVFAALRNGSGATLNYYKLDGTEVTNQDYQQWTNLKQSGSSDFFNATLDSDSFADGPYLLYVNASDKSGNLIENKSINITIDNTAPTVSLSTPDNNSNTTSTDIGFIYTATDSEDTDMLCNVTVNGTVTIEDIVSVSGIAVDDNITTAIASVPNGTHTWIVSCVDDVGNVGTSVTRTYYVETGAPTVTLNGPANYYNSSSTTVALNWTVDSPTYSFLYCNVSLDTQQINNTATLVVNNGTNKNWYNFSGVSQGSHEWNVSCWDALYMNFTSSTRTVTVDTTAPVVTAQLLADEANTSSTTPTFEANVSDNLAANFTCTLYLDGGTSYGIDDSVNNDTDGDALQNASITASTIAAGTHTWYVNCSDDAGNTGQSATRTLTVDTTAPVLSIESPANNTNQTTLEGVNLTVKVTETNWNISDVYAALKSGADYYDLNGTPVTGDYRQWKNLSQIVDTTSFRGTLNASNFSDGTYTIYANTSDDAGNLGTAPLMTIIIDQTSPVIQNISYNNASVGTSVGISVNVSDATSGVSGPSDTVGNCTFYFNNTLMASVLYDETDSSCNTTFLVAGTFNAGNYTLGINVSDWAGNNGSNRSYTIQIFSDTEAPSVTVSKPTNNTNQSSTSLNVTWLTSDNIASLINCNISIGSGETGNTTTITSSGVLNSTLVTVAEGTDQLVNVTCWDDALNEVRSPSYTFTIDTTAPTVALNINNNTNQSSTTFVLNWTVTEAVDTVVECDVYLDTARNTTSIVSADSGTNKNWYNITGLAEGNHIWYVNCSDDVGNTGYSTNRSFTIDSSVPSVKIVVPSAGSYNRTSLQINASAVDTYTNITAVRFRLTGTPNTTEWTDMTEITSGNYSATFTSTTVGDGSYNVQIYANDTLNNTNSTTQVAITIDNTAPALKSWNYSSFTADRNITLVFNETMDPSTIDLSKIAINYSSGSLILSAITSGATITSSNGSSLSTTINISLVRADYNTIEQIVSDPEAGTSMRLTIKAAAIRDRAGNNLAANFTKITNWQKPIIRRPEAHGQSYSEDSWASLSVSFTALRGASSLGSNYNITNVLASISGSYAAFYAYNKTSGSWLSYVPGIGGTFNNFTSDTDSRAYEINMTASDAIEIG